METITTRSSKNEIISSATEAIDSQQATITRLKTERTILVWLAIACLSVSLLVA
jgi:hypothetical protein